MAAYEAHKAELEALGAAIIAATVDSAELAQGIADGDPKITFPIAYGVTREQADLLGSWWSEDRGGYIQPTEFSIGRGGRIGGAMYASGPLGRIGADEYLRAVTSSERRRQEREQAAQ